MGDTSRENIRVVCRFRPLNKMELARAGGDASKCIVSSMTEDTVVCSTTDANNYTFSFDRIFGTNSSQAALYDYTALPVVDALFQGFNGCLLAYGQTGSGKTHTMMGPSVSLPSPLSSSEGSGGTAVAIEDDAHKGIIPRVIDELFQRALVAGSEMEFSIRVSFVEIYCEKIRDLFDPKNDNLAVGEDPVNGVYIKGVTEYYVTSREEVLGLMAQGNDNRAVSATGMNAGSSRSHSLFILSLTQKNTSTGELTSGKLYLVDLAGSETVSKTGASGQQLEELKKINKSLSSLGNVINSLTDGKSTHIPYRDSKLTRVLQECVGGNAKTTLIIACSPSSWNEMETLSTLRFGKRAKRIVNRATMNKERSPEEMKKAIGMLENAIGALLRVSKQWVHGAESGALVCKSGLVGSSPLDLPSTIRSTLAAMASGAAALEGKDVEAPGVDSRPPSPLAEAVKSGVGAGAEPSPLSSPLPSPLPSAQEGGEAPTPGEEAEDGSGQLTERDSEELERINASLIELLQEAGEELRALRSSDAELKAQHVDDGKEIARLKETITELDERVTNMTRHLSGLRKSTEMNLRSALEADTAKEGAGSPEARPPHVEVEVLRSNYNLALSENEELKAEIADLQSRVSQLEGQSTNSSPSFEGQEEGRPITQIGNEVGLNNITRVSAKSPLVNVCVYDVVWEHQKLSAVTGSWNHDVKAPEDPPAYAAAGSLPGNTKPPSLEAATAACRLAGSTVFLPSPLLSAPASRVPRTREQVALPSDDWYWSADWMIDTTQVDDSELQEAGWAYPGGEERRDDGKSFRVQRDQREGWQYAPSWAAYGGADTHTRAVGLTGDVVRRRRWVRPRVYLDITSAEASSKHLHGLASQLEVKDQMLTRMADELAKRQDLIRDYENQFNALMAKMSQAVETGDLTHIGQGSMNVGVHGSRILGAPSAARSIRGGGAPPVGAGTPGSARASVSRTSTSGDAPAEGGLFGTLNTFLKRFSSSPMKPNETATPQPVARPAPTQPPPGLATPGATGTPAPAATPSAAHAPAQLLFDACERGNLQQVQGILRSVGPGFVNCEDKVGRTPLLYAARGGQLPVLEYVASVGADLAACDKDGRNALHYAARRCHLETVKWLLERGMSVTRTDVHALTPLHQATLGRGVPVIQLLLEAGADINARDANGCTALKLAQRFDDKAGVQNPVVSLLQQWTDHAAARDASGP